MAQVNQRGVSSKSRASNGTGESKWGVFMRGRTEEAQVALKCAVMEQLSQRGVYDDWYNKEA